MAPATRLSSGEGLVAGSIGKTELADEDLSSVDMTEIGNIHLLLTFVDCALRPTDIVCAIDVIGDPLTEVGTIMPGLHVRIADLSDRSISGSV